MMRTLLLVLPLTLLGCATPPCPRSVSVSGDSRGTGWATVEFELGVRHASCASLNGGRMEKVDDEVYWEEPWEDELEESSD